jgi:hypothetical protein
MNNPPRKATSVAKKTTARKSIVVPIPQTGTRPCRICNADTNAYLCGPCALDYDKFTRLIGSAGSPSLDAMFRMYKILNDRIDTLESDLEISRIREKYHWEDEG